MNSETAAATAAATAAPSAPPPPPLPPAAATEREPPRLRPTLQPGTGESKRHVLDEDLHASFHNPRDPGRRASLRSAANEEEPAVSVSEEDASLGDDDDDGGAGASTGADSFCDASLGSEADPIYLSRGMSFSADGALVDLIDFYRKEITEGIDDDDDLPGMIADHAIRQAQDGTLDDLSEDALEAEIRRQMEEEDAMRKAKLAARKQADVQQRATGEDHDGSQLQTS